MIYIPKLAIPEESEIVSRKTFIVNDIIPIAIYQNDTNSYSILFSMHQNLNDEVEYIRTVMAPNSKVDEGIFIDTSLNMMNLSTTKDKRSKQLYQRIELIRNTAPIHYTDLYMKESDTNKGYYQGTAILSNHDKRYSVIDLYYSKEVYIRIKFFLYDIFNNRILNYGIFTDSHFMGITLADITSVKLDTSIRYRSNGNNMKHPTVVKSHYTMKSGNQVFKMNYAIPETEVFSKKKLHAPTIESVYNKDFFNDYNISGVLYDNKEDTVEILYQKSDKDSYILLRLNKAIYNKTNFFNKYNRIYEE